MSGVDQERKGEAEDLPPRKDMATSEKRNAFTELLSSKPKQPKHATDGPSNRAPKNKASFGARDGLGAYLTKPESYPSNVVVSHNKDFVVIHDMFPKSTLHLLLLPRDATKTRLHPFEAFEDAEFLDKVRSETRKLRTLAAGELRRKYGKDSAQEQARLAAMDADPPPNALPPGRDWEREVMCGVHAVPSMNHLHVHVVSVDRYSERMKHRKHYNSFATPFFVPIDDFPLAPDDARRQPTREGYLRRDFICWRCGKDFGNRFVDLKKHLEHEFEEWKKL
ncbi:Aprataxin-like protein [Penicillium alfredii]|uniref:Aprataxin-like protein n=1 Tax=Penicillium alfredii TaxID=1506179 RepID=A0A9W9KEI7_9EURO|nr:Aprataxin-like protein [Penicillium alfredii]KAJ5102092.1 Aprataxin-like protein [Penicillium alfredii]